MIKSVAALAILVLLQAPGAHKGPSRIDAEKLMKDVTVLAADDMEGRGVGTRGSAKAREFIIQRFKESGIESFTTGYTETFDANGPDGTKATGTNVVGVIRGAVDHDHVIVLTAHYDHIGIIRGEVFNGADDNASGVAALFAIGTYFSKHRPQSTIVFAALDNEELGLKGGVAFLKHPPVPRKSMVVNLNLDMIGRDENNTLWAVGTREYPFLRPYLDRVAAKAPVKLMFGHEDPRQPEDWTGDSDHRTFSEEGIPYVYFGVEDYAQHHAATDDASTLTPVFYAAAVETILEAIVELGGSLPAIQKEAGK